MVEVRGRTYKYTAYGDDRELYNLRADPDERENLARTGHDAEPVLRKRLKKHLNAHDVSGGDKLTATADEMNAEIQGRLKDLGYL